MASHIHDPGSKKDRRKSRRPLPRYPLDLPILSRKEALVRAIEHHQVVVVSGETGCGKTTQIPKFCLEAGRGIAGIIGCTQPRRIAAVTVARRIAEEMGQSLGDAVGYKIRFRQRMGKDPFIKIMTDGILLAETARDRRLSAYDTLILDEAHERSLNIDFILGYLRNLLPKRRDLKLVITSATLDTEKFSKAFGDAPIINVSGRTFPVQVRYAVKAPGRNGIEEGAPYTEMAARAVKSLFGHDKKGDILVFMPTERDIRETCEILSGMRLKGAAVLPLFARLPAKDQKKIFAKHPGQKIIVATNVAETSITIPGIRYVVDTGLARIARFSPSSRTSALPIVPVSRSSADQRKGRCGRTADGVCVRLFSEADYLSRELFTPPEILRANLAEVILKMLYLKMGDPAKFPFIDKPAPKWIASGYAILGELGALQKSPSGKVHLTKIGRKMARMPLDPRISRMLLEAEKEGCLKDVAVIGAALSIPDPRQHPLGKEEEARQVHRALAHPDSDFLTLLNLWQRFREEAGTRPSASAVRRFCRKYFLSFIRMRDWQDIHTQILEILAEAGLGTGKKTSPKTPQEALQKTAPDYAKIHRAVLSGFLSHIALRKEKNLYTAARGREVMLHPGSGLFNRGGEWIVAAEIVETSRVFARTAANIERSWLEPAGKTQCRYKYSDPFWSKSKETVLAMETVSLHGLPVEPGRPVPYGPMDPEKASAVFIKEALVAGKLKHPPPFLLENQQKIHQVKALEDKLRRRDLLKGESEIFAFYFRRLKGVFDLNLLKKRIREKGSDAFLRMRASDLMNEIPGPETLSRFPDTWTLFGRAFPLTYRFNPQEEDDGVTLHIPCGLAPALCPKRLEWLVPGLLPEKIETLIRALPKAHRKGLPPLSTFMDSLLKEASCEKGALTHFLSRFFRRRFGIPIPEEAWPLNTLPPYLHMRLSIETPEGKCIHAGRAPRVLEAMPSLPKALDMPKEVADAKKAREKDDIKGWDFGDLPEMCVFQSHAQHAWLFFPALEKDPSTGHIRLHLFLFENDARAAHPKGVAGLLEKRFNGALKDLKRRLDLSKVPDAAAWYLGGRRRLKDQVLKRLSRELFERSVRTQKEFECLSERIRPRIVETGMRLFESATGVLSALDAAVTKIDALKRTVHGNAGLTAFLDSLKGELAALVPKTFIQLYDENRMAHLPRYIRAAALRAEKGVLDFKKDQERSKQVAFFTAELQKMLETLTPSASPQKRKALETFFWLIEEFKVSLFAQTLKTPFPVSAKKLHLHLETIRKIL